MSARLALQEAVGDASATPAGLTTEEARRRLQRHGPNEPARHGRATAARQLLALFANPLVLILLLASVVSSAVGEVTNAAIIALIVGLSIALNFAQSYRSQRAADRLRESVALRATVRRDGAWAELPAHALVPGDVIRLGAGDLVPADARLLESRDLYVQQAALTGESLPVEKRAATPGPGPVDAENPATAPDLVFLGTSVVSGTAVAEVTATGAATAFGDVAARLAARPPETEFDRGTRRFGMLILETVLFLVLFVFLLNAAFRRDPLESLLFAVALAVGLTPEFLPMITTVTLAQSAARMARGKVIVKHLSAMQNFGSIDVLCSDKTGTLTTGDMALDRAVDPAGRPADRPFLLGYVNSAFETGVRSPLDAAILRHGQPDMGAYEKRDEVPFDFERRLLSVVVRSPSGLVLVAKGAPESVLARCTALELDGGARPLDAAARARCEAVARDLGADGYRVLAVAWRSCPEQDAYHAADEAGLTLAGFLAFVDPPLPGAAGMIEDLRREGVAMKILTGDSDLVARHVCGQVGLALDRVVLGEELDRVSDAALLRLAQDATVFARVSPAQKNRVILALKRAGHVVGYLGDGINDAPSLHAADVGISVASAVDVAKDAADIILLERGLDVLHRGILEGRQAFGNVMKYLLMGTSSNFGNMFSMAGASLLLPFLPMLPTQILLNNFLYDLAQVTIPTDHVDPSFVRKPRRWDISFIRDFMLVIGPISSIYDFLTFGALLLVLHASEAAFHTGWFVESLATQTLVLFVIRTMGNPLKSRPSLPLAATTLLVVAVGLALPWTPLAGPLGFVALPPAFFAFLVLVVATYLALVQLAKRALARRLA